MCEEFDYICKFRVKNLEYLKKGGSKETEIKSYAQDGATQTFNTTWDQATLSPSPVHAWELPAPEESSRESSRSLASGIRSQILS